MARDKWTCVKAEDLKPYQWAVGEANGYDYCNREKRWRPFSDFSLGGDRRKCDKCLRVGIRCSLCRSSSNTTQDQNPGVKSLGHRRHNRYHYPNGQLHILPVYPPVVAPPFPVHAAPLVNPFSNQQQPPAVFSQQAYLPNHNHNHPQHFLPLNQIPHFPLPNHQLAANTMHPPPFPFPAAANPPQGSAQPSMPQPPVVPSFTAPDGSLPGASNMVFRREKDDEDMSGEQAQEHDVFDQTSELRNVTEASFAEQRARSIARMASQSSRFSNQLPNASHNMLPVSNAGMATESNFADQRALSIARMSSQSSRFSNQLPNASHNMLPVSNAGMATESNFADQRALSIARMSSQSSRFSNQLTNTSHNMLPASNAGNAMGKMKADGNPEFESLYSVTADESYEYKDVSGETARRYNVEISKNITSKNEGLLQMDHALPNFPVTSHGPGYVLGNHPTIESGSVSQTFNILKTGEPEAAATGAQYLQDGMESKEQFKANFVGKIEKEKMAAKHVTQEHSHQSHPSSSANVLTSIGRSGDARQNADNHRLEAGNRDNVLEEIKVPVKRKFSEQHSIAEYHNMQEQVTAASGARRHNREATTLRSAVTDGISLAHTISKVAITSTSPDLTVSDHVTNKSGSVPEQTEIPSTCEPMAIATVAEDQYDDMVMSGDEVPKDDTCDNMNQKAVEDEGAASNTGARDLIAKFSKRLGDGVEKKKEVATSGLSVGADNGAVKKSPAQTRPDMEAEHLFRLHFTSLVVCLTTRPDTKNWGMRQPSQLKLCVPMAGHPGPHQGHVYWEHMLLSLQTVAWDYGFRACVYRRVGGATHHECSWARKVPVTLVPAPADVAGLRAFYLEEIRRLIDMIHPHVDCRGDGTVWIVVEGRKPQRFPYDPRFAAMSENLEAVLGWFPRGLTGLRQ
jgi:hypothetical protein